MNLSSPWLARLVLFAVVAFLLLDQRLAGGGLLQEDFKNVKSPKEAVQVVQERLKQDGKAEYAALLSETRIRKAIRTAIQSYEARLGSLEKGSPGTKEYFEKEVKPVFLKVADEGQWPEGCSFSSFYTLTERRDGEEIVYDGLGLRLQVETPRAKFKGFALPIVDLYFGRFGGFGE